MNVGWARQDFIVVRFADVLEHIVVGWPVTLGVGRYGMSSQQLVRAGQVSTLILVVLAAAWAPQIERFGSLFKYLQLVISLHNA